MKWIIFIGLFIILTIPVLVDGQSRLILNDNVYMVLDQGAQLVVENGSSNAITTSGTGGNIVSEGEHNRIKWNIGTSTGVYTVPFTTTPSSQGGNSTKIPVEIHITSSGNGSGHLLFATYGTADDNTPYPSDVTSMNSGISDGTLSVIDRFWIIKPEGYTANPKATIAITYDDAVNEIGSSNTISEAELQAQRWNSGQGDWEGLLFGTVNTIGNVVSGINVTSSDFYSVWTLVANSAPLPVELLSFESTCENGDVLLTWQTASELNNDFFIVESMDEQGRINVILKVNGAGDSDRLLTYTHSVMSGAEYYRLTQVDFDGKSTTYPWILKKPCLSETGILVYPNPVIESVSIHLPNLEVQTEVMIYNQSGKLIKVVKLNGSQKQEISLADLPAGVYLFKLSDRDYQVIRLIKQ